jgi:hypothetical protein
MAGKTRKQVPQVRERRVTKGSNERCSSETASRERGLSVASAVLGTTAGNIVHCEVIEPKRSVFAMGSAQEIECETDRPERILAQLLGREVVGRFRDQEATPVRLDGTNETLRPENPIIIKVNTYKKYEFKNDIYQQVYYLKTIHTHCSKPLR